MSDNIFIFVLKILNNRIMTYSFIGSGTSIIVTADTESGNFPIDNQSYSGASAILANDRIYLREYGMDKQNFAFHEISTIDSVVPTDLEDAFDKLLVLIANFNGGGTAPTGDYIPLAGTEVGSPVTGDIEVVETGRTIFLNNGEVENILNLSDGSSSLVSKDLINNYEVTILAEPSLSRICVNSNNPTSRGLTGIQDFTPNITDLDYTQKKYVDERGAIVNTTTATLSASDLNMAYPNAKDGFSVICPNVIGGGKYYIKAGAGWVYQQILAVV